MWRVTLAGVFLFGSISTAATQTEVLDQNITFPDGSFHVVSPDYTVAQTFTVGQEGIFGHTTMRIMKTVSGTYNLKLELRRAALGPPANDPSALLASVELPPSALYYTPGVTTSAPPLSVDWSAFNVPVHPGDKLALVARSNEPYASFSGYWWQETTQGHDAYSGGAAWLQYPPTGGWYLMSGANYPQDMSLSTYVLLPEPSALGAMGITIFAGVFGRWSRRRARPSR